MAADVTSHRLQDGDRQTTINLGHMAYDRVEPPSTVYGLVMRVLSGSTHRRFNSNINHIAYSSFHQFDYIYYDTPHTLSTPHDHKLHAILSVPEDNQWNFWLDDDAFFIDFSKSLRHLPCLSTETDPSSQLIFARSPVNPSGGWTYLSSGNFFFRSSPQVLDFFYRVLSTDQGQVADWRNHEMLGMYTNGDQDRITYQLFHRADIARLTALVPFPYFNTRPYHFRLPFQHLICHFAVTDTPKAVAIRDFQRNFGYTDDSLVPSGMQGPHPWRLPVDSVTVLEP